MEEKKGVVINIRSRDGEYRVPGPQHTEAQAYYTNDVQDAINTAISEYKRQGIKIEDIKVNGRRIKDMKKVAFVYSKINGVEKAKYDADAIGELTKEEK